MRVCVHVLVSECDNNTEYQSRRSRLTCSSLSLASLASLAYDRTRYNEYVLCLKNNDGDEDSCKKYYQLAASLCPSSWVR